MSYKDIRKNPIYVNLDSAEELSLMGNLLDEINIQNDYGTKVSVCYYVEGIPKFDKLLDRQPFYEYGLTFHVVSYENAFAFVLYNPEKQVFYDRVAIWKDQLNKPQITKETYRAEIIKVNKYINMFKTGGFGQGLIGAMVSIGIGHTLTKIRGIKTEEVRVTTYFLYHNNSDGEENRIVIYTPENNTNHVTSFFIKHYK